MLDLLRRPRWLAGLAVAALFAVVCVLLAQWQWHRHVAREIRNSAITRHYDAAPVELSTWAGAGTASPVVARDADWTPVTAGGRYVAGATVLVRDRPQDGENGYWVVVPFRLDVPVDGVESVWVVRGWLTAADRAVGSVTVPAPPPGRVHLTARLRPPESPAGAVGVPGQARRVEATTLAAALPAADEPPAPLAGYAVMVAESPSAPSTPTALERPGVDPGPHLAYTIQWYLFAVFGFVLWVVLYRRDSDDEEPDGGGPGTATARRARRGSREWRYDPGGTSPD